MGSHAVIGRSITYMECSYEMGVVSFTPVAGPRGCAPAHACGRSEAEWIFSEIEAAMLGRPKQRLRSVCVRCGSYHLDPFVLDQRALQRRFDAHYEYKLIRYTTQTHIDRRIS